MERYILFGGMQGKVKGGWNDFVSTVSDLNSAISYAKKLDWSQIVDTKDNTVVYRHSSVRMKF